MWMVRDVFFTEWISFSQHEFDGVRTRDPTTGGGIARGVLNLVHDVVKWAFSSRMRPIFPRKWWGSRDSAAKIREDMLRVLPNHRGTKMAQRPDDVAQKHVPLASQPRRGRAISTFPAN